MREIVNIAKALADENRLRVLMALDGRELCACHLVALLRLAPSTVSKHVSLLQQAGLVESRKSGRWVFFRTAGNPAPAPRQAIEWARTSLAGESRIRRDAKLLGTILKINIEKLCSTTYRKPSLAGE